MKPKWITIGEQERDLFEILDLIHQGQSIVDIAKHDRSISETDIRSLLLRTSEYLKKHLILDEYLQTTNQIMTESMTELRLEWSTDEITELVNLHICGATIEIIAQLMRKDESEIIKKLESLNLITERK